MNMHGVLSSSQKAVSLAQQMVDDHLATSPSSVKPVYTYSEIITDVKKNNSNQYIADITAYIWDGHRLGLKRATSPAHNLQYLDN